MKIVFVGQGPNQACWKRALATGMRLQSLKRDPHQFAEHACARLAITGAIGLKLAALAGYDTAQREELRFYSKHERRNLNARWNGKLGKGDVFNRAEAEVAAKKLVEDPALSDARFVLLGREVARAFGMDSNQPLTIIEPWNTKQAFLLFPHPSGISTWWNNPDNAERARVALRSFLGR